MDPVTLRCLGAFTSCLALAGCGCSKPDAAPEAEEPSTARETGAGGSGHEGTDPREEGRPATAYVAVPDTIAPFLRWARPRVAPAIFVDAYGGQSHQCDAQAGRFACEYCLDGRTEGVCDDETHRALCGHAPAHPSDAPLAARPVECRTQGERMQCWSELPGISNSIQPPPDFRLTWYFEGGALVGTSRSEAGAFPDLDPRARARGVTAVCEVKRAIDGGEVAVREPLALFAHRFWYPDPETPARNAEQRLCGTGIAELVRGWLADLPETGLDECELGPPIQCSAFYSHAHTTFFAADRGEGANPRMEVFAVAWLASALSEPYGDEQVAQVQAFLDRVRAGERPPRGALDVIGDESRSGPRVPDELEARITGCPP